MTHHPTPMRSRPRARVRARFSRTAGTPAEHLGALT
jgi:hypothetical protein